MFECLALCDVSRFMRCVCVENEFYGLLGDPENSRINNTFGMSIAGVRQIDSWGASETVVKIACAHLSQNIHVHNMRPLNSVFVTESSEHDTIHENIMRVNCEATVFRGDAGWIAHEAIIFIFNFQNICFHF